MRQIPNTKKKKRPANQNSKDNQQPLVQNKTLNMCSFVENHKETQKMRIPTTCNWFEYN